MKYSKPRLNELKMQSVAGRTCITGSRDNSPPNVGACKNGPAPTGTCKTGTARK